MKETTTEETAAEKELRELKEELSKEPLNPLTVIIGTLAVLLVIVILNPFYVIDAGERGVLLQFGAIKNVSDEGLHVKWPVVQRIVKMNIRTQRYEKDGLEAASSDQQIVSNSKLTVNYRLSRDGEVLKEVYRSYKRDYEEIKVFPATEGSFKTATAKFRAEELLRDRDKLAIMIKDIMSEKLEKDGIIIDNVEINNLDFSNEFNDAIERKVVADQNAQQAEFKTIQIREEALQAKERATGEAEAVRLNAEAEAEAIRIKTEALKESPQLIEYQKALRWDGKLPETMLGGAMPFFNIK